MPVEMEKPTVSFTDEAEMALNRTVARFQRRVRARAVDLAIKSRGTPSEITGSDIERAYREVLQPNSIDLLERKLSNERRVRKSQMLTFVSDVYSRLGLVIAAGGAVYPYIHARLANPTFRFSVVVVVTGLTLSGFSFVLRAYMRQREIAQKDEDSRRYAQFVIPSRHTE